MKDYNFSSTHLQREIVNLKKRIVELSAEVEHGVEAAYEALDTLDIAKANAVISGDKMIDQMEVDIEEECLKIMALYQPVAADLRMVVGVLKMNNDLERMGDLARNVAEYVIEIAKRPKLVVPDDFRSMFTEALNLVRKSLDAMVNADSGLAREVCRDDDIVDDLNLKIIEELKGRIPSEPANLDSLLYLLSISRSIERLADYATNIAEDVTYMVQGTIIRHQLNERYKDHNELGE